MNTPDIQPLPALVGNLWVPAWTVRPGAYTALKGLEAAMPAWLALHSRTGDSWRPCYASRETLGATLGMGRAKVSRQLAQLRHAALVFEVQRGVERKSQRHRPPARWALDPFTSDRWRPKVEEALARIAEDDGQDGRWYRRALAALDAFDRRSAQLRVKIAEELPPRLVPKPRRHRRRRAAVQNETWVQNGPGGDGGPGGRSGPKTDVGQTHEVTVAAMSPMVVASITGACRGEYADPSPAYSHTAASILEGPGSEMDRGREEGDPAGEILGGADDR